ncbi:hypothetical protein SM033_00258 [Vibrio phage vB_VpaM_sm033]|nr:hypothetical protein SM033_00258 [Vibrio phage vB_VpaM_sm033]
MRPADFIGYQAHGKYKPGKVIMQPGGWKNGYKQPDIPVNTGHNVLNNDELSKNLLDAIRWGVDQFYRHMDSIHGVSVMTKYYEVMIDGQGGPLYNDHYSERIIVPVYETVINMVVKNATTGNFSMIQQAGIYAKELCWDWMCRFWYEDPAREAVDEEWSVDYITRAARVQKDYIDLKNEIGSGIPIISNESKVYDFYITNKNKSLSKATTMTDILNGKGPQGVVPMPDDGKVRDYEDYSGHYPDVARRLENDARMEQRKLESQARGKTIAAALAASTKVHSDDAPMPVKFNMQEAEPIKITPTIIDTQEDEEEPTMMYTQQAAPAQQQNVMLVNHLNQPITTMQGQTLNVPAHIYQYGGAVMQRCNAQGQPYFDQQGLPIVVLRDPQGNEQFIELAPGQTAIYQQIVQSEQQAQPQVGAANGMIPQTAQQTAAPQAQVAPAANTGGAVNPDAFPGAELLGVEIDNTPKNPKTNAAIDSLASVGVHVANPDTTYAPAAGEGLIPSTANQESTPAQGDQADELEAHRFFVEIEGKQYHAALLEDEDYVSKSMQRAFVLINNKTHARAVAYVDDKAIEFIVERETFMNREKHLGYVLNSDKGEYTAEEVPFKTAENTMAVLPDQVPAELTENIIVGGDRRGVITEAAILQQAAGNVLQVNQFELNELQPIINVSDEVWDMWGSDEHEDKFQLLMATYNQAVSSGDFAFAHYLVAVGNMWITDVIYNRIGVPRNSDEQIEIFKDLNDYFAYLNGEGKWDEVLQELDNDWDVFFNIDYENINVGNEEDEYVEEEQEEPKAPLMSDDEVAEAIAKDVAETNAVEEEEEEDPKPGLPSSVAVTHMISGNIVFIPELVFEGESVLSNGVIDPTTSLQLWSVLKAAFDKIVWGANKMNYVYVTNAKGELMLFGSNDREFGYIRLIAKL